MFHLTKESRNESNTRKSVSSKRSLARLIVQVLLAGLIVSLAACSKPGTNTEKPSGNTLQLKYGGIDKREMPVKSGYAFAVTKTFTDIAGKITTAASYRVYAANYDLDSGNFALTLDKPLTSDEQVRVVFSLVADQGGNEKSAARARKK